MVKALGDVLEDSATGPRFVLAMVQAVHGPTACWPKDVHLKALVGWNRGGNMVQTGLEVLSGYHCHWLVGIEVEFEDSVEA